MSKHTVLEVKQVLKTSAKSSDIEALDEDALKAKEAIRVSIRNLILKLQLREQWLLHHVDEVHQYFANMLKADSDKILKLREKLHALEDINSLCKVENLETWNSYISTYQLDLLNLEQQAACYEKGSIQFTSDDGELKRLIAHFGKLANSTMDGFLDDSEKFSDFTEADTLSVSEGRSVETCSESSCCGGCANVAYEIEDMDKHLDNLKSFSSSTDISSFCKANEVCCNLNECLFDTPCHVLSDEAPPGNFHVASINEAMRQISEQQDRGSPAGLCDSAAPPKRRATFDVVVSELAREFERIMKSDGSSSIMSNVVGSNSFVDSLSLEMKDIINSLSCTDAARSPTSDSCPVLSQLTSDISSILSATKPLQDVSLSRVDVPPVMLKDASYYRLLDKRTEMSPKRSYPFQINEKSDCEKAEVDEDFYLVKKEGCCSISDVSDVLMSIIDS